MFTRVLLYTATLMVLLGPSFADEGARAMLEVEHGRVLIEPTGAARSFEVTGSFVLYAGDHFRPMAGSTATIVVPPDGPSAALVAGTAYVIGDDAVETVGSGTVVVTLGKAASTATPAEGGTATTEPRPAKASEHEGSPATSLAGTVTPIAGEVHLKEQAWQSFVRVPHRSSFSWGAAIEGAPLSRLQVSTVDQTLLRALGPVSVAISQSTVTVNQGTVLIQVGNESRTMVIETPVAHIRLTGRVIEITHEPKTHETVLRLYSGVAKLSAPIGRKGPRWSRYLSANRETRISGSSGAVPPRRFDKNQGLTRFIEGWKPEGPGAAFLPDHADDALLRQLRADQQPPHRPPPARAARKERGSTRWLRLRMRAMESPMNRRHYMTFKRYVDARKRRERYEARLEDDTSSVETAGDPEAKHHLPGGPSPKRDKATLRLLRWSERRRAQLLYEAETELFNQDNERWTLPSSILTDHVRNTRERLFGEPLRIQTRRELARVRAELATRSTRVADINSQLTTLAGIPGSEAIIRGLQAERKQLLQEADALKDSLEELISLH